MKLLEDRILEDCQIIDNKIIKVDSFINHQIDISLIKSFAKEVRKQFANFKVDKVLTIETSGIAIAFAVAEAFNNIPMVFAKKSKSEIVDENVYSTEVNSFTKNQVFEVMVSKKYIKPGENVLIVDDFLARGAAALGLIDICNQANANVIGVAVVIEKSFQLGRNKIEDKGIKVFAGVSIKEFKDNKPVF